jgi:hypothetical protein
MAEDFLSQGKWWRRYVVMRRATHCHHEVAEGKDDGQLWGHPARGTEPVRETSKPEEQDLEKDWGKLPSIVLHMQPQSLYGVYTSVAVYTH